MIPEFKTLEDLEVLHNDMHRRLFRFAFYMLPDKTTTVPTVDTLPSMACVLYDDGTTKRFYFNFLGTIVFWQVSATAALTAQLTTLTHTAPGTPDYAIQDFVDVAGDGSQGFSFKLKDEANTVLKVIANLQARLAEVEARLESLGFVTAN